MRYYSSQEAVQEIVSGNGHSSWPLLDEKNGCVNGCATGISRYTALEYTPKAYHDFQEGFYVISGSGYAFVGDEEFPIGMGMSFIVPRQVAHQLRSDRDDVPLDLFWFHAN